MFDRHIDSVGRLFYVLAAALNAADVEPRFLADDDTYIHTSRFI